MEDLPLGKTRRFLVVHPDVLIAQDLKEALQVSRGITVDLRRDLPEDGASALLYDVAVFGLPLSRLIDSKAVETMRLRGTTIVILDGGSGLDAPETNGFYSLPQPFRTEDVRQLLRQLTS